MKLLVVLALALASAGFFLVMPWLVFEKASLQYELFLSQKIFYYHVPAAFVMFTAVFVSGIASIGFLATRRPRWDDIASSAAGMVVVFGAVVLTSGPIWAKVAWGVWWTWDARLTLSLLLWLIFVAYVLVRRYGGPGSERLAAGLALFGMVDVPLVYFAVNFWKTQHPTNEVVPGLPSDMRAAFLVGVLAYFTLFFVLLAANVAVDRGRRRLHEVSDLAVEMGRLES